MRNHGLQKPFNAMQVSTWILHPILLLQFGLFCIPIFPLYLSVPFTVLFYVFGFSSVYFGYKTTTTDAIDDRLYYGLHDRLHPRILKLKEAKKKAKEKQKRRKKARDARQQQQQQQQSRSNKRPKQSRHGTITTTTNTLEQEQQSIQHSNSITTTNSNTIPRKRMKATPSQILQRRIPSHKSNTDQLSTVSSSSNWISGQTSLGTTSTTTTAVIANRGGAGSKTPITSNLLSLARMSEEEKDEVNGQGRVTMGLTRNEEAEGEGEGCQTCDHHSHQRGSNDDKNDMDEHSQTSRDSNASSSSSSSNREEKYCWVCQLQVNVHAMHCKFCDKCVSRFDHHCMWLNTCIGEANYELFFKTIASTFLFVVFHACVLILAVVLYFVEKNVNDDDDDGNGILRNGGSLGWFAAAGEDGEVGDDGTIVVGINIAFLVITLAATSLVGQLLFFHIGLRKEKITTYEFIIRDNAKRRDLPRLEMEILNQRSVALRRARNERRTIDALCLKMGGMAICHPCDPIRKKVFEEYEDSKRQTDGDNVENGRSDERATRKTSGEKENDKSDGTDHGDDDDDDGRDHEDFDDGVRDGSHSNGNGSNNDDMDDDADGDDDDDLEAGRRGNGGDAVGRTQVRDVEASMRLSISTSPSGRIHHRSADIPMSPIGIIESKAIAEQRPQMRGGIAPAKLQGSQVSNEQQERNHHGTADNNSYIMNDHQDVSPKKNSALFFQTLSQQWQQQRKSHTKLQEQGGKSQLGVTTTTTSAAPMTSTTMGITSPTVPNEVVIKSSSVDVNTVTVPSVSSSGIMHVQVDKTQSRDIGKEIDKRSQQQPPPPSQYTFIPVIPSKSSSTTESSTVSIPVENEYHHKLQNVPETHEQEDRNDKYHGSKSKQQQQHQQQQQQQKQQQQKQQQQSNDSDNDEVAIENLMISEECSSEEMTIDKLMISAESSSDDNIITIDKLMISADSSSDYASAEPRETALIPADSSSSQNDATGMMMATSTSSSSAVPSDLSTLAQLAGSTCTPPENNNNSETQRQVKYRSTGGDAPPTSISDSSKTNKMTYQNTKMVEDKQVQDKSSIRSPKRGIIHIDSTPDSDDVNEYDNDDDDSSDSMSDRRGIINVDSNLSPSSSQHSQYLVKSSLAAPSMMSSSCSMSPGSDVGTSQFFSSGNDANVDGVGAISPSSKTRLISSLAQSENKKNVRFEANTSFKEKKNIVVFDDDDEESSNNLVDTVTNSCISSSGTPIQHAQKSFEHKNHGFKSLMDTETYSSTDSESDPICSTPATVMSDMSTSIAAKEEQIWESTTSIRQIPLPRAG